MHRVPESRRASSLLLCLARATSYARRSQLAPYAKFGHPTRSRFHGLLHHILNETTARPRQAVVYLSPTQLSTGKHVLTQRLQYSIIMALEFRQKNTPGRNTRPHPCASTRSVFLAFVPQAKSKTVLSGSKGGPVSPERKRP